MVFLILGELMVSAVGYLPNSSGKIRQGVIQGSPLSPNPFNIYAIPLAVLCSVTSQNSTRLSGSMLVDD